MSHYRTHLLTLLLTALLVGCSGGSGGSGGSKKAFDYREITLDNGLKVVTLEDNSAPIVAVQLWYHVGSKDEDPERTGFAHMFEHMMFRGTDRLGPTDHMRYVSSTGGSLNAYTTFDQTVYHEIVPSNQLDMVLWLEAERMSFLTINQESFDTERKVVEEERRMGLNQPYGAAFEEVLALIFKEHPYRWSTIGNIAHLRAATVPELRAFWTKYYVPNNATLVIVGDIKHKDAQKLAERYFGWIPRYDDAPRVTVVEPPLTEPRDAIIEIDNAPAPVVGLIWRTVPANHKDAAALSILAGVLGQGESSRLYRSLVRDEESAVIAASMHMTLEQDGMFLAGALLNPLGGSTDTVKASLIREIERLRTEPVTEAELTKIKNQIASGLVTSTLTVDSKASQLGEADIIQGNLDAVNTQLAEVQAVTTNDLLRVAQTYLDPNRRITGQVKGNLLGSLLGGGKKTEENAPVTDVKETDPPAPGRPGAVRPALYPETAPVRSVRVELTDPTIVRDQLENGLKVIVVPNHEVPYVTATLGFSGGAWTESKTGTASLALPMLTKGSANHTADALAEELETYAISLGGGASMDTSSVSAACLTDQADRAMRLMAEVVTTPTFPEDEFTRLRSQVLTGLMVQVSDPNYLADRELGRRMYGDHPYGRTVEGEPADVNAVTTADMAAWWKSNAQPNRAVLIFAGDIDAKSAMKLARQHFGTWTADGSAAPTPPALPAPPSAIHIYLVDKPGAPQSQLRVAAPGLTRKSKDYPIGQVVSSYFGGDFEARLNKTIRVERGLTYGAGGGFRPQLFAGQFVASTFTKTETTAETVAAVLEELNRLRDEPPSSEELEKTKSYTLGSLALRNETPQQVAQQQWVIESNGLPHDFYKTNVQAIADTTADDCMRLIHDAIHPDQMTIVVVGDASRVKESLEKIAPVTVVK